MDIITYSLRGDQKQSDQYYRDVAAFTDQVLLETASRLQPLVEAFQGHLRQTSREPVGTFPEYAFDLLTLGVLWQTYASEPLELAWAPAQALIGLVRLRKRRGYIKPVADWLRGMLGALFLSPGRQRSSELPAPTLDHLDSLLNWLAAAGVFDQEVERLRAWRDFLASQPVEVAAQHLADVLSLASWFSTSSEATLGRYTPNVAMFLAEVHPHYRWREDAIFCGRRPVEYHLNMVGTELLDRVFREAFLATANKLVILPPCMKARPDDCQARSTPYGERCAGCTPGCRVNQVTKLGEQHHFGVLIMPDELRVFASGAVKPVEDSSMGIVGVSCALTNAPGGWETKGLGIPAQGVLLDYCGCRWHWHAKGIPTDINTGQLLKVLGIPKRAGDETKNTGPGLGACV